MVGRQPFVVALGDSMIGRNRPSDVVRRMCDAFEGREAAAVIALEEVPPEEVVHYGIARPAGGGELFELADLVEKPSVAEAPSNLAIAARYVFSPLIFDYLARTRPARQTKSSSPTRFEP